VHPVTTRVVVEVVSRADDDVAAEQQTLLIAEDERADDVRLAGDFAHHPLGGARVEQQMRVAVEQPLQEVGGLDVAAQVRRNHCAGGDLLQQVFELLVLLGLRAVARRVRVAPARTKPERRIADVDHEFVTEVEPLPNQRLEERVLQAQTVVAAQRGGDPELHPPRAEFAKGG